MTCREAAFGRQPFRNAAASLARTQRPESVRYPKRPYDLDTDWDVTPSSALGAALIAVGPDEPTLTMVGVDHGFSFLLRCPSNSIGSDPTGWPS